MNTDPQPDLDRRQLGLGLLAVVGGGLFANAAEALPRGARNDFKEASRILRPYGLKVDGSETRTGDLIEVSALPVPNTGYDFLVNARAVAGGIQPCIKTSARGDDANFTHFHPASTGEIVPCVKTTIEGHTLSTHELFDADQGGAEPCWRETAQMLDGGHIGTITATHFHPASTGEIVPCIKTTIEGHSFAIYELLEADGKGGVDPCFTVASQMPDGGGFSAVDVTIDNPRLPLRLYVGGRTYRLADGELVEERAV